MALEDINQKVIEEAKRHFKPELLNRLDEVIVFNKLSSTQLEGIAKKLLKELQVRAKKIGVELTFDVSAIKLLSMEKSTNEYGARPLKRKISDSIETQLSDKILHGTIKAGDKVYVYNDNGTFAIKNCGAMSIK